jgi:predicted nucleic acid-binding protein
MFGRKRALPYSEWNCVCIRATIGVSSADAIHLACAAAANTDLFLTNDKNLVGKVIPGIQFIASLETPVL